MPKLYKAKVDVSFPRPIRLRETLEGKDFWESEGISYRAGDTIADDKLLPRDKERAEKGELSRLIELIEKPKPGAKKPAAEKPQVKQQTITAVN